MPPKIGAIKIPKGPPQELISRITHLHNLLCNLPKTLPENPPHSLYQFHLDKDRLKQGGYFAAAGHALELSFETHLLHIQGRPIRFSERGERHDELQKFLKKAVKEMTPGERDSFKEAWIERLITAAIDSGAKIPRKRKTAPDGDIDDRPAKKMPQPVTDSSNDAVVASSSLPSPPPLPSSSSVTVQACQLVGNPKQLGLDSFGWGKATPADVQKYWDKATEDGAE